MVLIATSRFFSCVVRSLQAAIRQQQQSSSVSIEGVASTRRAATPSWFLNDNASCAGREGRCGRSGRRRFSDRARPASCGRTACRSLPPPFLRPLPHETGSVAEFCVPATHSREVFRAANRVRSTPITCRTEDSRSAESATARGRRNSRRRRCCRCPCIWRPADTDTGDACGPLCRRYCATRSTGPALCRVPPIARAR